MEIFNAIKQDHDHQRALLNMLAETSGDSKVREKYYKELKLRARGACHRRRKVLLRPINGQRYDDRRLSPWYRGAS